MSLHEFGRRRCSSRTQMRSFVPIVLALLLAGPATVTAGERQVESRAQEDCVALAHGLDLRPVGPWHLRSLQRKVNSAVVSFRFHRIGEAIRRLDSAVERLHHLVGPKPRDKEQQKTKAGLAALRTCLSTVRPPSLATVTIRTFGRHDAETGEAGESLIPGAYIDVERVRVGRTGEDGRLTLQVPSGDIRITATVPPSSWGEASISLEPDASSETAVPLLDGKEPSEDTELVVVEAPDGILPAAASSFTLHFMRDDEPVAISEIDRVELLGRYDDLLEVLDDVFIVAEGAIAAGDLAVLHKRLAQHLDGSSVVRVRVTATDLAGLTHAADAKFYVGRHRLTVTLIAPPSNPAVPTTDVEVSVTLMESGISLRRISDTGGRFEVEWLPDAVLAFDAETLAGDKYYYAQATMTHWTDCSIRLVLRHVSDLIQQVPGLVRDETCPPPPPLPRNAPER